MESFTSLLEQRPSLSPSISNASKSPKSTQFMNLFKSKVSEKISRINCNKCGYKGLKANKHKYCFNCGHFMSLQLDSQQTKAEPLQSTKSEDKKLKKKLIKFTKKRFNLVAAYQNQCKIMDELIIDVISAKINIETEYIRNNEQLIIKCHKKQETMVPVSNETILFAYGATIQESVEEHQKYLSFLEEILTYLRSENSTMIDFISNFKDKHDENCMMYG